MLSRSNSWLSAWTKLWPAKRGKVPKLSERWAGALQKRVATILMNGFGGGYTLFSTTTHSWYKREMNGTFLIVEDQENDAFFLMHALKKAGIHNAVQVVDDGQKALDYLSGAGRYADRVAFPMPSVIFLDLKLPQVNGLDVLHWVRAQTSLPPMIVVVLTSSSLEEDIVQAYRLGANSYVVKPSNIEKLVDTVKDFANWWLKHDQLQSGPAMFGIRPKMSRLAVTGMSD